MSLSMIRAVGSAEESTAIGAIYNEVVAEGGVIYEEEPRAEAAQSLWMKERLGSGYPLYVARAQGRIMGFAYFSQFRQKTGYALTAEISLHLSAGARGRGYGKILLEFLEKEARVIGYHTLIGAIDAANERSCRLHERAGFLLAGELPEVALLRGERRTVRLYQKILD